MSEKHSQRKLEIEMSLQAKFRLEEVLRQAHYLDLSELERIMFENRPMSRTAEPQKPLRSPKKRRAQSRGSSKTSFRGKTSELAAFKTSNGFIKDNPE